jgi:hypothetical protein
MSAKTLAEIEADLEKMGWKKFKTTFYGGRWWYEYEKGEHWSRSIRSYETQLDAYNAARAWAKRQGGK